MPLYGLSLSSVSSPTAGISRPNSRTNHAFPPLPPNDEDAALLGFWFPKTASSISSASSSESGVGEFALQDMFDDFLQDCCFRVSSDLSVSIILEFITISATLNQQRPPILLATLSTRKFRVRSTCTRIHSWVTWVLRPTWRLQANLPQIRLLEVSQRSPE